MADSQEMEDHEQTEEIGVDFESLIKGIEDIQNHALDQHELHLDSRVQLRNLEDTIEKTCQTVKQIKAKNMEDEGVLHALQCQDSELKQNIARETALLLAAEETREAVQRNIDTEKANYLNIMIENEKMMASYCDKFRQAPVLYGTEKMKEQTLGAAEGLDALKAKDKIVVAETGQLLQKLKEIIENIDPQNLRLLIEEVDKELQSENQNVDQIEKQIAECKETLGKLELEKQQLSEKYKPMGEDEP